MIVFFRERVRNGRPIPRRVARDIKLDAIATSKDILVEVITNVLKLEVIGRVLEAVFAVGFTSGGAEIGPMEIMFYAIRIFQHSNVF